MCCMTSDFANIGHTTTFAALDRFLFPRERTEAESKVTLGY